MRANEYESESEGARERRAPRRREDAPTQAALAPGAPPAVQRAAMLDLQRAAGNARASSLVEEEDDASDAVRGVVGSSSGQPLDRDTRSFMESQLGQDFGGVRVHTGGEAAESAHRMSAQAYTVGNDIVFGEGKYDPASESGRRTLAHELTHVVQQRSGPVDGTSVGGGLRVSDPSDRFEQAAERSADAVMSGASAGEHAAAAQRDVGTVQREEPEEEELQMMGEEEEEELQMMGEEEEEELQAMWMQRESTEEEAEEEELAEG